MSPSPRLDSPPPPSAPTGASSRLILLADTDDGDPFQEYTTDEEDDNENNDAQLGTNQLPVPPLSSAVVFLYLLSPYLRLGAIYASDIGSAPLAYGLPGLVVAATLSAFCRQIWFLLGRYVRKSSTEDILVHMIARRRRRVSNHGWAAYTFTIFGGLFRILLAAMYLRDSVDSVLLLKLPEFIPTPSRLNVSVLLCIAVFVLSLPRSLASKSIVYTIGLSVASYVAWLVAVARFYGANEPSLPNPRSFQRGVLWNEISSLAFACTTTMTVPLSASLAAKTTSNSPASRNARARKFQLLNMLSTVLAILLLLPPVIMAASPRTPASVATDNIILGSRIATLVLSIPSVVVSITLLPLHGVPYRMIRTDLALVIITAIILAFNLVPPTMAIVFGDVTLFSAVFGGFLLPALAHITIHYLRRPLSIVVPHRPSSPLSSPRASTSDRSPSPSRDPLLQRKERLLQRRRFGKRVLWDIVNWIVLIPICVSALVWAIGRLARRW